MVSLWLFVKLQHYRGAAASEGITRTNCGNGSDLYKVSCEHVFLHIRAHAHFYLEGMKELPLHWPQGPGGPYIRCTTVPHTAGSTPITAE